MINSKLHHFSYLFLPFQDVMLSKVTVLNLVPHYARMGLPPSFYDIETIQKASNFKCSIFLLVVQIQIRV